MELHVLCGLLCFHFVVLIGFPVSEATAGIQKNCNNGLQSIENIIPTTVATEDPFFPPDRTLVTWAHGVNSIALLNSSLEDSSILMLEADIQLGYLIGSLDLIPIMAHPPALFSDLSFEMFLSRVLEFNSEDSGEDNQMKGLKLDFKQLVAVEPVLKILRRYNASEFNFPVWLNADILPGPINSTGIPVNGEKFISLTSLYLPEMTLSLGWTTRYSAGKCSQKF